MLAIKCVVEVLQSIAIVISFWVVYQVILGFVRSND
jgi:hypothetical protein